MTPRVAIITRTKDRPLLLERAIGSVLDQTFTDWLHVIVNDGGDAQALETLLNHHRERYGERLKVIHHEQSQGMQEAANAGISGSESAFLAVHDDDDSWDPRFLEVTVDFLEAAGPESPYHGVITHTLQVEETVKADGQIEEVTRRPYIPLPEISLFRVGYENPFPPIAFCYRRSAYLDVGPYNPEFTVAGDYDFNFRFLRKYEIGVVPEPLAFYHLRTSPDDAVHGNSVRTSAGEHKRRYNEFKNHYLRGGDASLDPALAVGLNAAKYLVELEWLAHEINRRAEKIEGVGDATAERIPTIESQLHRTLSLQDTSFRELLELARDPRILDRLGAIARDLSYGNQQVADLARQHETRAVDILREIQALHASVHEQVSRLAGDLSHANEQLTGLAGQTADLARQHETRAVDILREIQAHHTAMHEAMREKALLQIGPLRIGWKKKRRPNKSEA